MEAEHVSDREWWETNLPPMALADIRDFANNGVPTIVAFTANGGYALATGTRYFTRNIPQECFAEIERNSVDGFATDSIAFASNDSWAVVANRK
jgi:hypothetical protein